MDTREYCPCCDELVVPEARLDGNLGINNVCPVCGGYTEAPMKGASYELALDRTAWSSAAAPQPWRLNVKPRHAYTDRRKVGELESRPYEPGKCEVPACPHEGIWCIEGLYLCRAHKNQAIANAGHAALLGLPKPQRKQDYIDLATTTPAKLGRQRSLSLVGSR